MSEEIITNAPDSRDEARDERRTNERARLIVDVFFDGNDATGIASTKDISSGGLYMNTQANLPEGALLLLRIPLGAESQIVINGEVVYSHPGRGVGVRFHNLSDDARRALDTALVDV